MGIQNIPGKQGFAAAFEAAAPLLVNTDGHTEGRKTTEYSQQMAFLRSWEIRARREADRQLTDVRMWSRGTDSQGSYLYCRLQIAQVVNHCPDKGT